MTLTLTGTNDIPTLAATVDIGGVMVANPSLQGTVADLVGISFEPGGGSVVETLVTSGLDIGLALFMGMVTLSGGMILFSMGSRVVPAASATLMSLVEVFLAPVWMWLLFGQTIGINTAIGGGIVLAAVVLNALTSGAAKSA